MLITNGQITDTHLAIIKPSNAALTHGHSILEDMRIMGGQILFWEAHYLKIMASMRMLRIAIPMDFTPEKLSALILSALSESSELEADALVRFQVYPHPENFLETNYHISLMPLVNKELYSANNQTFEMGLYKDYYIGLNGLSSLATSNQLIPSLASIFAFENDFHACFLLNTNKEVIGTNKGTLYMLIDQEVHTADLTAGAKNTVFRKVLNTAIEKDTQYKLNTGAISPFSLQKAKALCIVNPSDGVIQVTKYRKKTYEDANFGLYIKKLLIKASQEN